MDHLLPAQVPECKFIHQEKAPFKCPLDGGDVEKRRWRGGSFWGCSNYPKCNFAIFGEMEQTPCPRCNSPYLIKKIAKDGSVILQCGNKMCGYQQITGPDGEVTESTIVAPSAVAKSASAKAKAGKVTKKKPVAAKKIIKETATKKATKPKKS